MSMSLDGWLYRFARKRQVANLDIVDLDLSNGATGTRYITLKDAVADALSVRRGTTDVIVFDTSTPKITITPRVDITGALNLAGGIAITGSTATAISVAAGFTTGLAITNATLAVTSARAIKVSTSQAAAAMEDGYGVVEIDHTITGTAGSNFSGCALSAWVNIPSGTVGAGKYVCAQNNGIYEDAAAVVTNAKLIFGMRAQKLVGDTDSLSFPFSVNTNNTAITAFVDVNNHTDMGWIDGVLSGATLDGHVPLFRTAAGVVHYVNTYID